MEKFKSILLIILSIAVVVLIAITATQCNRKPEETIITKIDTTYIIRHDTVSYAHTINHFLYHYDTIQINDTVYIKDEPQLYKDSTNDYNISINAVKLYDYDIDIYKKDSIIYIDKEVEKTIVNNKKWNYGVYMIGGIGYGTNFKSFNPYIGVTIGFGFGYNIGK